MMEKQITFSQHSLDQLVDRGTSQEEVLLAIKEGEKVPAKKSRISFKKSFPFEGFWKKRYYSIKQVMPIVVEEENKYIVVTVYVFFTGVKNEN